MCGIIGRWNYKEKPDAGVFLSMRDSLMHRGPDGEGFYVSPNGMVMLGHRRLSFLDLGENGAQPMPNENRNIYLTINGEIYNYRELRKELISRGHSFRSHSDSEVVLHGYEEWGENVVDKLYGMFAFCIYDQLRQKMFLARDRFGIKPLYYYKSSATFIFASEIKGIAADPGVSLSMDVSSFADYFTYRYIPSPATIWKDVFKLPAAHTLSISSDGNTHIHEYWKPEFSNERPSEKTVIEKTDEFLSDSVAGHILSDVPVGSFLSGGYDSSALVYYMHRQNYPLRTFAIGFRDWEKSEHRYAETVASLFKADHHSLVVDEKALSLIDTLVWHYDEPIADISIVPTFAVSGLARQHVKAVLSGEGADELFGGYTWHKDYFNAVQKRSISEKIFARNFATSRYSNAMAMGLFDKHQRKKILSEEVISNARPDPFWFYRKHYKNGIGAIKSFQYLDIKTFMGELVLTKIDRASMGNSLEVRVPFLDHRLVEYIMSIDESVYYKPAYKKFLLFENIKNVMPAEILDRSKQGFVGPDSYYMDMKWYRKMLDKPELQRDGLINSKGLNDLFETSDHWRLWKLTVMERWYRRWVSKSLQEI